MNDLELLRAEIAALKAELASVYTHDVFNCTTRKGLEQKWRRRDDVARSSVFADIDSMHSLNEELGYDEVDRRIRSWHDAIELRDGDSVFGGQFFGGDEFAWFVPVDDARGFAQRVYDAAVAAGLSVTMGVTPSTSPELASTVKPASALVQQAKAQGTRGVILFA